MAMQIFQRDPNTGLTPLESRILATLVENDGMVLSDQGTALAKLRKMVPNPHNVGKSSFGTAVRSMEKRGLVQRDLRNPSQRLTHGAPTSQCFGVALAVEPADLPPEIHSIFVPEYRRSLQETITPTVQSQPSTSREPDSSSGEDEISDEKLAELADQVFLRAVKAVEEASELQGTILQQGDTIRQLSGALRAANNELTRIKDGGREMESLRRTNEQLTSRVNEQAEEIRNLHQQLNARAAGTPTRRSPITLSSIERLVSERPNGMTGSSARPVGKD